MAAMPVAVDDDVGVVLKQNDENYEIFAIGDQRFLSLPITFKEEIPLFIHAFTHFSSNKITHTIIYICAYAY